MPYLELKILPLDSALLFLRSFTGLPCHHCLKNDVFEPICCYNNDLYAKLKGLQVVQKEVGHNWLQQTSWVPQRHLTSSSQRSDLRGPASCSDPQASLEGSLPSPVYSSFLFCFCSHVKDRVNVVQLMVLQCQYQPIVKIEKEYDFYSPHRDIDF